MKLIDKFLNFLFDKEGECPQCKPSCINCEYLELDAREEPCVRCVLSQYPGHEKNKNATNSFYRPIYKVCHECGRRIKVK